MPPAAGLGMGSFHAVTTDHVTPRKRQFSVERFNETVIEFESVWKLGLAIPERQSPSKIDREDFNFQVYNRFRILFFKGQLDDVLDVFRKEAIEMAWKWVKRSRGEPDTTPSVTGLPRAITAEEKKSMKTLLRNILDGFRPSGNMGMSTKKVRSFKEPEIDLETTPTRQRAPSPELHNQQLSPPPPKRSSSELFPESKRPRSKASKSSSSRSRSRQSLEQSLFRPRNLTRSRGSDQASHSFNRSNFYQQSAHTSKETFVTASETDDDMFSQSNMPPPASQETQTTIEASSQEQKRLPPPPTFSHDAESLYSVSSSMRYALNESFSRHEKDDQLKKIDSPKHSSSFSEFSLQAEQELFKMVDCASSTPLPSVNMADQDTVSSSKRTIIRLEERLHAVWPTFPPNLEEAPLAIRWELLRVCLHAGVDIQSLQLQYDPAWKRQDVFWKVLGQQSQLSVKPLAERSSPKAWQVAIDNNFQASSNGQVVVLCASLDFNTHNHRPLFVPTLRPLRLDLPHRLDRRFGSDRFLEIIIPSIQAGSVPETAKRLGQPGIDCVNSWLSGGPHYLLGRHWKRFFTVPFKEVAAKKPSKNEGMGSDSKQVMKHRLYFFAENGDDFQPAVLGLFAPNPLGSTPHTTLSRDDLISWLLQIHKNVDEPFLKLFSRIKLGLSRTVPTVVLRPEQIRHCDTNLLSPIREVMNDGCGRLSLSLARKVRDALRLDDIPAGFQGRLGSAKGFWIVDVNDNGTEDWIETYPSQRKWKCDFKEEDNRTFEVKSASRALKSANLNYQFLPILQDRATDSRELKQYIGDMVETSIRVEIQEQRLAIEDPVLFRKYVQDKGNSTRQDRLRSDGVPFMGGLPSSSEEQMAFLLDGGFHPKQQSFLWNLSYKFRYDKCEEIMERMHIRVGRSTYVYMVVDFWGVLEEDEVHLGFSSNFRDDESGFSETYLHNMDVLVARSPAHFASDIQKVRAVFKPELGFLKDVIIFPRKGAVSLANKLSGGDYDGDMAWVCWDPGLVQRFNNANVPDQPDLSGFLTKETETLGNLIKNHGWDHGMSQFFEKAFDFNMQPNLLGICTNFKDKYCYQRGSVADEHAVKLCTLLSNLVDQAKQGITFTFQDWTRFRKSLPNGFPDPPDPLYKTMKVWTGKGEPPHITDYLKLSVLNPVVERELASLDKLNSGVDASNDFDRDLTQLHDSWSNKFTKENRRAGSILTALTNDVRNLRLEWDQQMTLSDLPFEAKVTHVYEVYRAIRPRAPERTIEQVLTRSYGEGVFPWVFTEWDLLKASTLFKLYYRKSTKFMWWVAGREFQMLKAMSRPPKMGDGGPRFVTSEMVAALRPDAKYISDRAARMVSQNVDLMKEEDDLPPEDDV